MTALDILIPITPVVTIVANVAIIFNVVPAFKQTKNRAFLFIGLASLLSVFDTVCDHTIALDLYRKHSESYRGYRIARKFTYIADCVMTAAGITLLARAAVTTNTNTKLDEPSSDNRNASSETGTSDR